RGPVESRDLRTAVRVRQLRGEGHQCDLRQTRPACGGGDQPPGRRGAGLSQSELTVADASLPSARPPPQKSVSSLSPRTAPADSGTEETLEQTELMSGCLVGGAVPGLGEGPFVEGPQQGEHGQGLEVEGTGPVDCTGLAPGDEHLAH